MQQNVRIGMPKQAFFVGNGHAPDDKVASLDQLVHIKTLPNSHFDHFTSFPFPRMPQIILVHEIVIS
jgi:hypothetical protein